MRLAYADPPEPFCRWVFEWLSAQPEDDLDDLFPGSGNVGRAWSAWQAQPGLFLAQSSAAAKRADRRAAEKASHPQLGDAA